MKMTFKISMNQEEKDAGNVHTVELEVAKCDDDIMLKYALKAYTVEVQSQIRNNWDAFVKGDYPKSVRVGEAVFASGRGVVTKERAKAAYRDSMAEMTMLQKLMTLHKDGMLPDAMYEASVTGLFEKGKITKEELDEALTN